MASATYRILGLLNMDEKDKTLLDDTPDEGEDVPARRVAELAR